MNNINNYNGKTNGIIDFELIEKLINKASWKYIWISPSQMADKYNDFCGFISVHDHETVKKCIQSVTNSGGAISELKLFSEDATFYIIADGNNIRWSCWLRNDKKIEDYTVFETTKEAISYEKSLVVEKSVLLRDDSSNDPNKVKRGLGKASIKSSKLNFDCYYIEGSLKFWFLGGNK